MALPLGHVRYCSSYTRSVKVGLVHSPNRKARRKRTNFLSELDKGAASMQQPLSDIACGHARVNRHPAKQWTNNCFVGYLYSFVLYPPCLRKGKVPPPFVWRFGAATWSRYRRFGTWQHVNLLGTWNQSRARN